MRSGAGIFSRLESMGSRSKSLDELMMLRKISMAGLQAQGRLLEIAPFSAARSRDDDGCCREKRARVEGDKRAESQERAICSNAF